MPVAFVSRRRDVLAVLLGIALAVTVAAPAASQQPATGRIAGRVVDRATGRPLPSARITLPGQPVTAETDLDGRFRLDAIPVGLRSLRAAVIGYRPVLVDSIDVKAGQTSVLSVVLESAPVQLAELSVEATVPQRAATDAGLLAQQHAAPSVSDGLSAEALRRTPDSDAGDAIARVTGISVVDKKFVVVRGMSERYSSTMLNGTPLPSPEPLRRVVPLDIFPANLLESIVTTKGATPDKPGDFAGGMVEIKTKEFPDAFVAQLKVSQEYNSNSTFQPARVGPRGGTDFLGFDDGRRGLPSEPPTDDAGAVLFAERVRNVWTPGASRLNPNTGVSGNIGGQFTVGGAPVGALAAVTYSSKGERQADRLFQFVSSRETGEAVLGSLFDEGIVTVDWGLIANVSTRPGQNHKLGLKNFYTRNAEELFSQSTGFDKENGVLRERFQVRYVERDLHQSQLSGEHFLPGLAGSRVEWRGTVANATRDEPENRVLAYQPSLAPSGITLPTNGGGVAFYRFLDDKMYSGNLDWAVPLSLRAPGDAEFKVGAAVSRKDRAFSVYTIRYRPLMPPPDGLGVFDLPPELLLAPENLGRNILVQGSRVSTSAYEVDDDLYAAYAMADMELVPGIRVVGGLRAEDWRLDLFQNTRAEPIGDPVVRRNRDYLWSTHLTAGLSAATNLRLGASRTVNRPDSRELSEDEYAAIGGECVNQGNPELQRAAIRNLDVRLEHYPRAGELIALSGFYKRFDTPIVEVVDQPTGGQCRVTYRNAERGTNYGAELEARKQLDFLSGFWERLAAGFNLTVVRSRATLGEGFTEAGRELPLLGQSPLTVNGSLSYLHPDHGFDATVLVNYFDDRVVRYGLFSSTDAPHVTEKGRVTLDAKAEKDWGSFSLSLSGRNLTNNRFELFQDSDVGPVPVASSRLGITISLGVGYAF